MIDKGRLTAVKSDFIDIFTLKKDELGGSWLTAFVVFAFLIRLPLIFFPEGIYNDGVEYIRTAKYILAGNWSGGFVPPVYPALIAVLDLIVKDFELAGILASALFGAVLVLPVYHFTKEVFDTRTASVAALFTVFHPLLFTYSGSVLTESTYYFFVAMIVFLGWLSFARGRLLHIVLFSFFSSLAYLTKPEGVGFLFVFLLWVISINPPGNEKRLIRSRLRISVVALVSFIIFSLPYLVQMKRDLGTWEISKKASISLWASQQNVEDGGEETVPQFPKRRVDIFTLIKNPFSLLARICFGLFDALLKFQQGLTPYLFLFAIIGFLRKRDNNYPWKPNLYILSNILFFFGFVLPFFWITKRHTSHMIPMVLPWVACGFLIFVSWSYEKFKTRHMKRNKFNALCLVVIMLALLTQGVLSTGRGHRQVQKDVGLWMRANLPGDAKFMSRLPQEGFYAQLAWTRIRKTTYSEILIEARSQGANYLVIDDVILKNVKDFRENMAGGDLFLIKEWEKDHRNIFLFKIVPSFGSS
jgi:4-amino-4-deoxy-L-arabinose transferase-like glycosyltransferase